MKIIKSISATEVAMPRLIPQEKLNKAYVTKWKNDAEKALRVGRNVSQRELKDTTYLLYHWKKSSVSGVWFISIDGKNIDYLYAYQGILLDGVHKASEALAFLFNEEVRGVTKGIFFDHLLPDLKFVITDSVYTPDGYRWFRAEYNEAFWRNYNVYAIVLKEKPIRITKIEKMMFQRLQEDYWGIADEHQGYRFAIELT